MKVINPKEWKPVGVDLLEPNADKAIRSQQASLILAGPGAGKTELLAQKAIYLFQTNICPAPKRILAISYKKDSAKNLEERVLRRCLDENSRLDSMTFDSFAKNILDRFIEALPSRLKIKNDYELKLKGIPFDYILKFSKTIQLPKGMNGYQIRNLNKNQVKPFLDNYFYGHPLKDQKEITQDEFKWLADELWEDLLFTYKKSALTFPMITRLAEKIITNNPLIRKALLMTYSDVFLDEFQDTTNVQFDLLKAIFKGTNVRLTAVGDNKQRIMGFAMALENSFENFKKEFGGETLPLYLNFRSAKNLVKIQHSFAKAIDGNTILQDPYNKEERGTCNIAIFKDEIQEAYLITKAIQNYIKNEEVKPSDIVILSKQLPEEYARKIIENLNSVGIKARVETDYQDLLKEDLIIFLTNFLIISTNARSNEMYLQVVDFIKSFKSINSARELQMVQGEIDILIRKIKDAIKVQYSKSILDKLIEDLIKYLDIEKIKGFFPQYEQGDYLNSLITNFLNLLNFHILKQNGKIKEALEDFIGLNTIKVMTVHKSKGLEFHTVLFIGLEDGAFWSFDRDKIENISTFYVGLSRARERIVFTFSEKRLLKGKEESQSNQKIEEIYTLLRAAGVPEHDMRKISK